MDITVIAYLIFLASIALLRIWEMRISKRNQLRLIAQGAVKAPQPKFRWVVLVHLVVLLGSALEVLFLHRPFIPVLAGAMIALFLLSNALRLWVILAMGQHWNVQVVDSTRLGVITGGPFRFVRHPNYAAIFVEMIALPLIHTAWITALVCSAGYAIAIGQRIVAEERVLFADPVYRSAMSNKPRFLPGIF
ncbi:MAG: isoprenylcysteine carboxyl methyltransferase family protein [Candidatus Acidiferrum sp.]